MARAQKRPAAAAAWSARREIAGGPWADWGSGLFLWDFATRVGPFAGSSGEQREEVKVIEISHEARLQEKSRRAAAVVPVESCEALQETSEDAAPSEGYEFHH